MWIFPAGNGLAAGKPGERVAHGRELARCRGAGPDREEEPRHRPYIRKTVARPRKMKKPMLSVMKVRKTLEPTAGSLPKRSITSGIV